MKRCFICDELKPLTEFHKASGKPDGLRNDCKICRKLKRKPNENSTHIRCYKCGVLKEKNEENFTSSDKTKLKIRRCCKECNKKQQRSYHLGKSYDLSIEKYN